MKSQIASFEKRLREKLPTHESADSAAQAIRAEYEGIARTALPPDRESDLCQALENVKNSFREIEVLRRSSLITVHDEWYTGPRPVDRHWPAVKGYLENTKNWEHESITSIDTSSTEIVSLLANPAKDTFHYKGLVVGYVQSGKTANMTAVIAKAVDAGYNLVVLLSGVTNKLRLQTQQRIVHDIVERNRALWQLYTTDDEDHGDFSRPANRQFTMPASGQAQLAVMKKETNRLGAFLATLKATPPSVRKSLKALVIDDECDQASVDASGQYEDPSRINSRIRKIVQALPAVSYVGYTATPFANVFINPFPGGDDIPDDLYPADFITALPRPNEYFGAYDVFGYEPDDADNPDEPSRGLDMTRIIASEELPKLRCTEKGERKSFFPETTPSLERALLWFLASCAVRRHRGQSSSHMTMLVHASQYVNQHTHMAQAIRGWLDRHSAEVRSANGEAWQRLKTVWEEETTRVPLTGQNEENLNPAALLPKLKEAIQSLEVVVENGESNERLAFGDKPRTYIVVGGSVLARGLTLEGLTVSFFLRTSRQYDTLLQMGRWFGFRKGYADLPRLWTTQTLISNFRALARIEDEIREDIAVYREHSATPLDFAVKVRSIPGMAITGAAKMRSAYKASISFAGKHVQTIWFDHLDRGIVGRNLSATIHLINDSEAKYDADARLFRGIPSTTIRKFLREYCLCDRHLDLKEDMLLSYLDKAGDSLGAWNMAVVSPHNGEPSRQPLGFLGQVRTNRRSRLSESDTQANIKALMSKKDILVDAESQKVGEKENWAKLKERRPDVPLLLIYPINAQSEPTVTGGARVALDAVDDLVGIGIVFPGSQDRAGDYYSVELDVPTPEQLDEDKEGEPADD